MLDQHDAGHLAVSLTGVGSVIVPYDAVLLQQLSEQLRITLAIPVTSNKCWA